MIRHPSLSPEKIDWGDDPVEPPPPPSAGRSFRLGVSAAYDYMGTTILASAVSFALMFLPVAYGASWLVRLIDPEQRAASVRGLIVLLPLSTLILSPFIAGLYALAATMFRRDDPHFLTVFRQGKRLALGAWALGFTQLLVTVVLSADTVFLLTRPQMPFKLLGILTGYILLLWAMMATYHWPLLIEQEKPLRTTLYRAFLLTMANPWYTLITTFFFNVLLIGPILLVLTWQYGPAVLVPVSLAWGALLTCLQTSATLEILRKYDTPAEGEQA